MIEYYDLLNEEEQDDMRDLDPVIAASDISAAKGNMTARAGRSWFR